MRINPVKEAVLRAWTCYDVAVYLGCDPKRSGSNWKMKSVFRAEKTASLVIYSDHWTDYGEPGIGGRTYRTGNAVDLWMAVKGIDFRDALLEMCAARQIPVDTDYIQKITRGAEDHKESISQIHGKARIIASALSEKYEEQAGRAVEAAVGKSIREKAEMMKAISEMPLQGDTLEDENTVSTMLSGLRLFGGDSAKEDVNNLTRELYGEEPEDDSDIPEAVDLDAIPDVDESKFLWFPYVPMQEVTVLAAPGGTGKGMLFTLMAARLSSGIGFRDVESEPCPDRQKALQDGERAVTLILSKEDGATRIKPRFLVSGGATQYLKIIDDTLYDRDNKEFLMRLNIGTDEGCYNLERWIRRYNPKLVVIDPITSFMAGRRLNNGDDARLVLSNLTRIARITDTAIIAVTHTRKGSKDDAAMTDLIAGSHEIKDVARSVLMIGYDIEDDRVIDEFDYHTPRRLMYHVKTNHSTTGKTVRYYIAQGKNKQGGGRFPTSDSGFPTFSEVAAEVLERTPHGMLPALYWKKLKAEREARRNSAPTIPTRLWTALTAVMDMMKDTGRTEYRISYKQFEADNGGELWSSPYKQGDDLTKCVPALYNRGFMIQTSVKTGRGNERGFLLKLLKQSQD